MPKKGSTIKFWTDSEIKACKTCNEKFENTADGARFLAPKLGRTFQAVYVKMNNMKNGKPIAIPKAKVINKGIELPEGFTFDITKIKRAVLFNNSVTLYF